MGACQRRACTTVRLRAIRLIGALGTVATAGQLTAVILKATSSDKGQRVITPIRRSIIPTVILEGGDLTEYEKKMVALMTKIEVHIAAILKLAHDSEEESKKWRRDMERERKGRRNDKQLSS